MTFDPYHTWLGIPPDEQPANHYRLLGIPKFESDADVIDSSAERQTIYLRTFQTGPESKLAERLLNEIAVAKICLLNKKEKKAYDVQLSITKDATFDQLLEKLADDAELSVEDFEQPIYPPPRIAPSPVPVPPIATGHKVQLPQLSGNDPGASLDTELDSLKIANRSFSRKVHSTVKQSRKIEKNRRKSSNPTKSVLSIVLGGIGGICVAIVLLWFVWHRDPFGIFSQQPNAEISAESESPNTRRKTVPTPADKAAMKKAAADKLAAERAAAKKIADAKAEPEKAAAENLVADEIVADTVVTLKGHSGDIQSVAFSPDGKRIDSGSSDKTVKVWDAQTGQVMGTLNGHSSLIRSVGFSPDGKWLASGSDDQTAKVWDAKTGQEMLTLKGHDGPVRSVSFSPDGKRIVSGSFDKTVKVWDARTGRETRTLKGHAGFVLSVAFSPDGKRIVSGSRDATLKVWDAETGQEMLTLKGHSDLVTSVAFSPDGKRIVSGSFDKTVKVWDARTGRETRTLKGHSGYVRSVAFSPDGTWIVSGSYDQTVKVWNAVIGREIGTLSGHTADINSVAFSPNGKRIVSGSSDYTVKVWSVSRLADKAADKVPNKDNLKSPRLAVPTEEATKNARSSIREVFKDDYEKTNELKGREKLVALRALAEKIYLLQSGEEDPTTKYVVLDEAYNLARLSCQPDLTWRILDDLSQKYEVDSLPRGVSSVQYWSDQIPKVFIREEIPQKRVQLIGLILPLVKRAEQEYRFDVATELYALTIKQVAGEKELLREFRQLRLDAKKKGLLYEKATQLTAELVDSDDTEKHQELGEIWCFGIYNWKKGLPHLAQGSNKDLQGAAKLDLDSGAGEENAESIGDRWWDLSLLSSYAKSKAPIQARAVYWYAKAIHDTTELSSKKLLSRIEEAGFILDENGTPKIKPKKSETPLSTFFSKEKSKQVVQHLQAARDALKQADFPFAEQQVAAAQKLNPTEKYAGPIERLRLIGTYAKQFQTRFRESVSEFKPGSELHIPTANGEKICAVVEATPQMIILRVDGQNQRHGFNGLNPAIAIAMVHTVVRTDDPIAKVIDAAFLATRKNPTSREIILAQELFKQARGLGADIGMLELFLQDDYERLINP